MPGGVIGLAALRWRSTDQRAQTIDEALRVRQLRPARVAPMRDETVNCPALTHPLIFRLRVRVRQVRLHIR